MRPFPSRSYIKHLANVLTSLRMVLAVAMLLAQPFSAGFWIFYLCAGASDMLDGAAARALKSQSAAGARLDSVADAVFALAIAVFTILHISLPSWMWIGVICIAALRFAGYGIGFHKYHAFSPLHTYANKVTGALIFAFPLLYCVLGLTAAGAILLAAALASSAEEAAITVISKELDRDCKSFYSCYNSIH